MCCDVFMSLFSLYLFLSPSASLSFPGYPSSQVNLEHKWIKGELRSLCKVKPFQISAQMKGGPAHTCALTLKHVLTCVHNTSPRYPPTRTHIDTHSRCVLWSRYVSVDLWMSVSVCWECLSSPCFWASCQAQLPAVLGQGNTMALNVAHHPPSILYQLGRKLVQREDKEACIKFYRNIYRYGIHTPLCTDVEYRNWA